MSYSQISALFFGVAVGDALGCPVQFYKKEIVKSFKITGMIGHGCYNLEAGTWTDDTSMTLALADSLASNSNINYEDIMIRFQKWLLENQYTPFGKAFDMGQTCIKAIIKSTKGIPALECGGIKERENGNGSLMRISPIVFYIRKKFGNEAFSGEEADKAFAIVENVSRLTHAHTTALIACDIYIALLNEILNGKKKKELLESIFPQVQGHVFRTHLDQAQKKNIDLASAYIHSYANYKGFFSLNFQEVPEDKLKNTGYVVDTLFLSLWGFFTTNSYKDCLLKVVNLGGDADTAGAVSGGIAALYYLINCKNPDEDFIPQDWLDKIRNKTLIEEIIKKMEKSYLI